MNFWYNVGGTLIGSGIVIAVLVLVLEGVRRWKRSGSNA